MPMEYFNKYLALDEMCTCLLCCAVPPAYYAHLAAFRARFYMEPELQENGCGVGQGTKNTRGSGESGVRPLPALKENVKRVMFYC